MIGIDVPTSEQIGDEQIFVRARVQYEDCEIVFDHGEYPDRVDGGAWLAARVWVSLPPKKLQSQGDSKI